MKYNVTATRLFNKCFIHFFSSVDGAISTVEIGFSQPTLVIGCPVVVTCYVKQDVAMPITYKWYKEAGFGLERKQDEIVGETGRTFKIPTLAVEGK